MKSPYLPNLDNLIRLYTSFKNLYNNYEELHNGGRRMDKDMGMTNKQFQAFIRLMELVRKLIKLVPEEEQKQAEKEFEDTLQLIKEDN